MHQPSTNRARETKTHETQAIYVSQLTALDSKPPSPDLGSPNLDRTEHQKPHSDPAHRAMHENLHGLNTTSSRAEGCSRPSNTPALLHQNRPLIDQPYLWLGTSRAQALSMNSPWTTYPRDKPDRTMIWPNRKNPVDHRTSSQPSLSSLNQDSKAALTHAHDSTKPGRPSPNQNRKPI